MSRTRQFLVLLLLSIPCGLVAYLTLLSSQRGRIPLLYLLALPIFFKGAIHGGGFCEVELCECKTRVEIARFRLAAERKEVVLL